MMVSEKGGPVPKYEESPSLEKEQTVTELVAGLRALRETVLVNPDDIEARQAAQALVDEYLPKEDAPEPRLAEREDEDKPSEKPELTPEREESQSLLSDVTFETARKEKREFTDEFIADLLEQNLRNPGQSFHNLKSYMDELPPDTSDKEFFADTESIVTVHEQLTDFIADEIKVLSPPQNKDYLEQLTKAYANKIRATKPSFREYVDGRAKGLDAAALATPEGAIDFKGFNVPVSGGRSVNLLTTAVDNLYPNIKIQDGAMAPFVHWSSQRLVQEKMVGREPKLAHRIYLNPKMLESVEVFKDLIDRIEQENIEAKAKIYDPINNSIAAKDPEALKNGYSVRGDTIVAYAVEADVEKLLKIVEEVYARHEDAFEGRKTSRIPLQVAPGVALGDEPKSGSEASLTSHRVGVMESVRDMVTHSGETDPKKRIDQFRSLWRSEALRNNINPDNPAFNS